MSYVLQENYKDATYIPKGSAKDFIYNHDPEVILAGPAECLAGETLIHDHGTGLDFTIQYMAENKIAPSVMTLFGVYRAEVPFRKGRADLYRVTLASGHSFVGTGRHRVLTASGWKFVSALRISECLLLCDEGHPSSTSELCRPVSLQDAQYLSRIVQGSQSSYSADPRLSDGERLPVASDIFPDAPPLPDGAPSHSRVCRSVGDRASLLERTHLHRSAGLPSIARSFRQHSTKETHDVEYYSYRDTASRAFGSSLSAGISLKAIRSRLVSTSAIDHGSVGMHSLVGSPDADYTVFGSTVVSVEYERTDDYYDMTVPGPAHYIAGGMIHHNTGKTLAACWKAHLICCKYPGAQGALIRKTGTDISGTVFLTMRRVILGAPVDIYGGTNHPKKLIYSNGSVIWIGGMDNPGKVLSGERDFIQVCQAEELRVEDWELMTTRVTGRGAVIPYPQIFGDCNPAGSKHFILERKKAGALVLMKSIHRDNPTLFDDRGVLTDQGTKTMARLQALTGVRRKRLLEGIWASAEGGVFDMFDPDVHVRSQKRENYREFRLAIDEGYVHPAVILVIGVDLDGRRHIFEEYYETGKLQSTVVAKARELGAKYNTSDVTVDASAAGLIADLRDVGMQVKGGKGRILDRISAIQDDLAVQGDGRPRLTFDPSCVETINDFESYEWKPEKDEPKKENDDAPDALGYDYDTAQQLGGGFGLGYRNVKKKKR